MLSQVTTAEQCAASCSFTLRKLDRPGWVYQSMLLLQSSPRQTAILLFCFHIFCMSRTRLIVSDSTETKTLAALLIVPRRHTYVANQHENVLTWCLEVMSWAGCSLQVFPYVRCLAHIDLTGVDEGIASTPGLPCWPRRPERRFRNGPQGDTAVRYHSHHYRLDIRRLGKVTIPRSVLGHRGLGGRGNGPDVTRVGRAVVPPAT